MRKFNLKYGFIVFLIFAIVMLGVDYIPAFSDQREAFLRMQQFAEQGKIPAYVIQRGIYKYVDGTRSAHVKGRNVFMRSQPLKGARIIAKLNDVDLNYLGEWTHPDNGERWVCVRKYASNEIGWIYGQYIELLKETSAKGKQMSVASSKEDKKTYKKNKDCAEDPCGALGGFLLISPILYWFDKIGTKNKNGKNTGNSTNTLEIFDSGERGGCPEGRYITYCKDCSHIDPSDSPYDHQDYAKCRYFGCYVLYWGTPQDIAPDTLSSRNDPYKDECCPEYRKAHCGSCSLIDLSDEYHGYYKCTHFNCYVDADYSPQYNSNNKKYM